MARPYTPPVEQGSPDVQALTDALARAGTEALLPPRIAGTVRLPAVPVVRDALTLPGGALLAVLESGDEVVAAPLVPLHGGVRRALAGDGAFAGILRFLAAGEPAGRFRAEVFGDVPESGEERAIDVDQSNDSVTVGERAVVKVYPRVTPGPQPGLDVPAHLAAVGFAETPAPFGAVTWRAPDGRPVLLATVAGFLPGARDGWDWFVELVLARLDGDVEPQDAVAPAGTIGGLVARLHVALATRSAVFPTPVLRADRPIVQGWLTRAEATLAEALALTAGPEGERLQALAGRAGAALRALDAIEETPTTRVHGDLHVGQILRWDGGYAVSDFDGNPLAPQAARMAPDSPARDVASMARAIDHVGRVVRGRRPGRDADIDPWIEAARERFLAAYRAQLASAGRQELLDERLLRPFEVAQECHEYVYAARYLPRWLYVPDLAMPALLARD